MADGLLWLARCMYVVARGTVAAGAVTRIDALEVAVKGAWRRTDWKYRRQENNEDYSCSALAGVK